MWLFGHQLWCWMGADRQPRFIVCGVRLFGVVVLWGARVNVRAPWSHSFLPVHAHMKDDMWEMQQKECTVVAHPFYALPTALHPKQSPASLCACHNDARS